jgi:hypothetical protein
MGSKTERSDADFVPANRPEMGKQTGAEGEGGFDRPTFETPIAAEDS